MKAITPYDQIIHFYELPAIRFVHFFLLSLILHALYALYCTGYYHPDEQFQILEFATIKLPFSPGSPKGAGFPMLHIHIMNIKGWLRGVHHKCETHRLQQYLDEYHFRFNRRGFLKTIFDKLITKMTEAKPVNYKMIKCELNT